MVAVNLVVGSQDISVSIQPNPRVSRGNIIGNLDPRAVVAEDAKANAIRG